ncbi:p31 HNH DNAse-like protein [Erwinia phage Era103]|uniref:p31 HNH DNAse-like protein n=1 Tax=Erwinia phage Era103 TaxID=418443 RepID=A2I7Y5_9CAUD|nr:p31 HNH DNAse-like protein [Erwinia phage Era103]ABM63407.1 p31 HNH DNAse-like protein [Erwinia phage Era103]
MRLYHNRIGKTLKAHRLVALHFVPNPLGLPEVNHIDEDKTHNDESNLEWMTTASNVEYSHAGTYTFRNPKGEPVVIFNLSKFCRENKLTQGSMSTVKNGRAKSHKGWTYLASDNNHLL